MRLWLYLSLIVNSVTLLVFVAYAAFDAQQQSQQRLQELQRDASNISQSLAAGVVDDLLAEDLDKLEHQLKRTMVISNVQALSLRDAEKNLLLRVLRLENGDLQSQFEEGATMLAHSPNQLMHVLPIDAGKHLGWVETVLDLRELEQLRRHIWRDKLLSAILISMLLSIVFFIKLRRDSRVMEAASRFACQLGQADQGRLQLKTPISELTQLQQSLNQVSQLLQEQFATQEKLSLAQQQTNQLLQESLNELAARQFAIDQHAIVSISDLDGCINYANQRFCELSGYEPAELLGQNHRLLKSGEHGDELYHGLWSTITEGKVWHGEITNRGKQGHLYWLNTTIVPMLSVEGVPRHYIAISTDISYQHRTHQQLSMNQKYLEQMVEKYRLAEQQLAQAQQRELSIGHQIQQSMLFGEVPARIGSVALAVYSEPSRGIDGDFYQLIHLNPQSFDFSIGDVMGKGIPAALVGAAVKLQMNQMLAGLLARRATNSFPSTDEIINQLHQHITPQLIELDTFVTLSYLRFDLARQQLRHINAGHNPSLLCRGQQLILLQGDNIPLGVMSEEVYHSQVCDLQAGDMLFLYSDGITEAKNDAQQEFGLSRLSELVLLLHQANIPAAVLIQAVRYQVCEFENHNSLSDDRTCLAVQILAPQQQTAVVAEYPWQLTQLDNLRLWVMQHAAYSVLDQTEIDSLLLATIEAASNSVRHNPPRLADARLYCQLNYVDNGLMLDLYYLGEPFTAPDNEPDFSGASEGGFGLFIIRNSVNRVDYRSPAPHVCQIHLEKYHEEYSASSSGLL